MSFGKLKTRLKALINRKDLTDELAGDFITQAIADLERDLRIGAMETVLEQTAWDGVKNALILPGTFLETINLFTDTHELVQVDLAEWLAMDDQGGDPTHYVPIAGRYLLRPTPAVGSKVYLHCYVQAQPLAVDEDENVWTRSGFNACLYTAAALAGDFYQMEDEYASRFSTKAQAYVEAIAGQDLNEKWSGRLSIPAPQDIGDY
jgi:hypothetical protein